MSGGRLDYFFSQLECHAGDFKDKELDNLVADLSELFYAREWFLSGDTCEGDWNEARDAFKKKWFSNGSRPERFAKYLEEIKEDLMKQFGLYEHYCRGCAHWSPDNDFDKYGSCDLKKNCLMHRSESCDQFAPAGSSQKKK